MAALSIFKGGTLRVKSVEKARHEQVPVSFSISSSQRDFLMEIAEDRDKSFEDICKHAIASYIYAMKHSKKYGEK